LISYNPKNQIQFLYLKIKMILQNINYNKLNNNIIICKNTYKKFIQKLKIIHKKQIIQNKEVNNLPFFCLFINFKQINKKKRNQSQYLPKQYIKSQYISNIIQISKLKQKKIIFQQTKITISPKFLNNKFHILIIIDQKIINKSRFYSNVKNKQSLIMYRIFKQKKFPRISS
ncbi:hypothetical protein IMG5_177420, partial [Ichthyophthirius multifiliis]